MRRQLSVKVVVFSVVLSLLAWNSVAAEIHVDAANQSGFEDGTLEYPFNTVQEGLNAASAADTVLVAPGIYYGAVEMKSGVKLIGVHGPDVTIIDGMGAGMVVNSPYAYPLPASYLEGFTVRNGNVLVNATNRVSFWSGSTWKIVNCILKDATNVGMYVYPGAQMEIQRSVISNMKVGIDFIWCPTVTLKHVTMDSISEGALKPYQTSANLFNSTFTNVGSVIRLWGSRGSGSVFGQNNNFWNYQVFDIPSDTGYPAYINLTGSLYADPLFADRATGDYHLTSASPLIDAGVDLGSSYVGSAPDIGAYEFDQLTPAEMVLELVESYQDVPVAAFKNAADQRIHALQNKLMSVLEKLDSISEIMDSAEKRLIYEECLNKLQNDILAKADGFYGGNPNNDWIVTREEQDRLHPRIMELIDAINTELQLL